MGSVILHKLNERKGEGWSGYSTLTGYNYASSTYGFYSVYSCKMFLNGSTKMTGCRISTNFSCTDGTHTPTLRCYLYVVDPTGSEGSTIHLTPPTAVAVATVTNVSLSANGAYVTFNFTGLNITTDSWLFFWFEDVTESGYTDAIWHTAVPGYSNTREPYVEGTFSEGAIHSLQVTDTVTAGNKVSIRVSNAENVQPTYTIKHTSSNRTLASGKLTAGAADVTCPASWFDDLDITTQTELSLAVTVTHDSTTLIGNFTLKANDAMKPSVGTPTASIVQGSSASTDFPNTYIANISSVKVAAAVALPTEATIRSVVLNYGNTSVPMTYNGSTRKYEATTSAPITGNTTFTVVATDTRGLQGSATVAVTGVVAYTPPSINIVSAGSYRCDASGAKTDGGAYYRVQATPTYYTSSSFANSLKQFNCKIEGSSTKTDLPTDGTQSSTIGGDLASDTVYTVVVTIEDKISGEITKTITLQAGREDIVWDHGDEGTYVGVGMAPQTDSGASTVELPEGGRYLAGGLDYGGFLRPSIGLNATGGTFGQDFLAIGAGRITEENQNVFFYKPASDSAWSNTPADLAGIAWQGFRQVLYYNANLYMVIIIELRPTIGRLWFNRYYSGSWSGWKSLTPA